MRSNSSLVSARRPIVWPHSALAALVGLLAFNGCSAGLEDEADGPPDFSGQAPAGAGGQTSGSTTPGSATAAPPTNTGAPTASGGEQTQGNGAPIAPSTNTGNTNGTGGTGNASNGAGGAGGTGMVAAAGSANVGAAGSAMGNAGAGAAPLTPPPQNGEPPVTTPPVTPPPVTPPPVTPPPVATGPDIPCPANATFCSGFEASALPAGASSQGDVVPFEFDATVRRSGNQSVLFPAAASAFNIREIIVPIPGQTFWARLFVQTSTEFGDNDHDSLFVGSTATPQQDNNQEHGPEFSEQGNQVVMNADDALFSAAGPGFPQAAGTKLSAGTWHCLEGFFDGGSGDVQFFADGDLLIDAPGFARVTYQTFRFGYLQFPGHAPRDVWFDDVVVAADRVGCD